jgi:hypothetical protein
MHASERNDPGDDERLVLLPQQQREAKGSRLAGSHHTVRCSGHQNVTFISLLLILLGVLSLLSYIVASSSPSPYWERLLVQPAVAPHPHPARMRSFDFQVELELSLFDDLTREQGIARVLDLLRESSVLHGPCKADLVLSLDHSRVRQFTEYRFDTPSKDIEAINFRLRTRLNVGATPLPPVTHRGGEEDWSALCSADSVTFKFSHFLEPVADLIDTSCSAAPSNIVTEVACREKLELDIHSSYTKYASESKACMNDDEFALRGPSLTGT